MKQTFYATFKDGQIIFDYPKAFELAKLGLADGQRLTVTLNTDIPKTKEQLGYYWGVVVETFRYEGSEKQGLKQSKQDMHEILLSLYRDNTGQKIDVSESTQAEMSDYIDWCVDWVNDMFNTQIPKAEKRNGEL